MSVEDKYEGFIYTFVVQCEGMLNHAQTEVVATYRIGTPNNFLAELKALNKNSKILERIDVGDMNFANLPIVGG